MKRTVGVIFGGRSGEHAISLLSARSIIAALDGSKYEIVPIAITREGTWQVPVDTRRALEEGIESVAGWRTALLAEPSGGCLRPLDVPAPDGFPQARLDVAIPVLHGTFGEDGTVQALLEMAGVAYVGSGVAGSAVGMDKILMKAVFASCGFPQAPYHWFPRSRWEARADEVLLEIESRLGMPCFVKPANLGSSVGISKAYDRDELRVAIDLAARYDRRIVVEAAVAKARELECSVLGNDEPEASVVGEVVPSNEFYDYEAKYIKNDSSLIIPADVPSELSEQVRRLACEAFKALDLAGLSRVDFLVDGVDGRLYLNEVNTMPGFTRISMYPKLWEASGVPYPRLLDRLIDLALARSAEKASIDYCYVP